MLCSFLLYNSVNQLCVYIHPFLSLPPRPPPHPCRSSHSTKLNSLCCSTASHQLSALHMVVYISIHTHTHTHTHKYMSMLLSQFILPLLPLLCTQGLSLCRRLYYILNYFSYLVLVFFFFHITSHAPFPDFAHFHVLKCSQILIINFSCSRNPESFGH